MDKALLEDIKRLTSPLLARESVELVELLIRRQRDRFVLGFLVTRPGGITLDECAQLNREISQILDQENLIQETYILEVSSPGLDRPLVSTRDFQRCLGKLVKVVLRRPLNGQNVWIGFLDGIDEQNIIIRTEKEKKLRIARRDIARARVEVQL